MTGGGKTTAGRILSTDFDRPLKSANYLGDYEAIVTRLDWESLIGYRGPEPGKTQEVTEQIAVEAIEQLEQRSNELESFLEAGRLLVAEIQPASTIWGKGPRYDSVLREVETTYWLATKVRALLYPITLGSGLPFIPGSGTGIEIREVGHPLEDVIRAANRYTGRIAKEVFDRSEAVVLATTLIGDPVAAEITVGLGLVLLVPTGVDRKSLLAAVTEIVETRARHRQQWLLPEEAQLFELENTLRRDTRDRLKALAARQESLAALRTSVMKGNINIQRAIVYYENGTSATRPPQRAMQDLYKLVELLEGYFGGSEAKLATALSVEKARFMHIKKLANQPVLDLRHATSGETVGADAAEVQQARDDAKALVQRFIEVCCDEELNRRSNALETRGSGE